jgi:Helitron helicase-like domain at N-terminus
MGEIVRQGGPRYQALKNSMLMYQANLNGSSRYLCQKRIELETIIEEVGPPTLWFLFSMADNHWHDLHQVLCPGELFDTVQEAVAFLRQMVRENPQAVQDLFQLQTKAMLDTFLGKNCFKAQWWWMHFELH